MKIPFYCIINLLLIKSKSYQQTKQMFGDDIFIDDGFGGQDVFIDNGFGGQDIIIDNGGFFGGTDVIIDNGYGGYGGMDMGMGMAMGMGMGMGYGANTTIVENRGLFGGRQQVIVNNGYGMGGGTTIIQDNGLFGRRQQIIVNNGYGGYGMGGNTTTIVQNRGLFGGREEIIVDNSNGYGGGTTIIEDRGLFGNKQQIIINNGYGMGGTTTIVQNGGLFGPRQQIIVTGGNGVIVCPPGCMGPCCRRQNIVACPPSCMGQCCINLRRNIICPANCTGPCCIVKRPQPIMTTTTARPVYAQNPVSQNPYQQSSNQQNSYQKPMYQASQQAQSQILAYNIYELKYGKWQGLKPIQLTTKHFHNYSIPLIKKIKCRTNLQPYSNQLQGGQIVMKIVIGQQDLYYAAPAKVIREYFHNLVFIKARHGKQMGMDQYQGQIDGMILKKSDIIGKWDQRYVEISKMGGLKSYRNRSMGHTVHIPATRQLWTWFEVIQGNFMVIKLKHGMMKTQFAIPMNNKFQAWIQAFLSLLEDYN